jgi:tRNA pseudouridine32 synthase/23S rRNA pseudouridine746 synthase
MIDSFRKVYQDRRVIVLDKPAGLPAVPGRGEDKLDSLSRRVQAAYPTARVVHRLDWATSGLMVMALDLAAERELGRQFAERIVEKRYVAVVRGEPTLDDGVIALPLRKDFERPPRHCVDHVHGRTAITEWHVVERLGDRSRVELAPLTGRSHQLRIHLSQIGHPILGDTLYADEQTQALADRLLLHAERLTFHHPDDGRRVTFTVPCPF